MNSISCLFLDIGGVLLSNGWSKEFRELAAAHFDFDAEEMEKRHNLLYVTYEEGKMTLDNYLNFVLFYSKRDFTQTEFLNFIYALSTPNLEMIALIKKLKSQYGLKIIAVSNEAREINAYRINKFKLTEIVDFFVSSCYVQVRKPDTCIYRIALDGCQVPIDKIIYIDDVQVYVNMAKEIGINGIHHTDYLSTTKALADLGLIIKQ